MVLTTAVRCRAAVALSCLPDRALVQLQSGSGSTMSLNLYLIQAPKCVNPKPYGNHYFFQGAYLSKPQALQALHNWKPYRHPCIATALVLRNFKPCRCSCLVPPVRGSFMCATRTGCHPCASRVLVCRSVGCVQRTVYQVPLPLLHQDSKPCCPAKQQQALTPRRQQHEQDLL
jgi:hypothetical protein